MQATILVLSMLLAVALSRFIARFSRLPTPLVQIALGAAIYYVGVSAIRLDPEVFFLLLLPPLLFIDGWRIPKDDLFREAPTILTLAFGLVIFTVLGAGLLIHWLIPAMPLPVAFALAAVISPTDPIAVSAIAARAPIPLRMMRILQGEALFNDASGLVCMRFAVAAMLTGSFALHTALASFLWLAVGGLAIGAAVPWLISKARPQAAVFVDDDGGAQILTTLLIPFGVYLLAESLHCSGILAAVAAGITMSFTPYAHWHPVTRIRRTAVWETVQFIANGSIFVLLGQQIPLILSAATQTVRITGYENPWWLGVYVLGIVLALLLLRLMWVWASLQLVSLATKNRDQPAAAPNWRVVVALSLAGVRGAITLAGVLTLPLTLTDGSPFPTRDLAIFLAAGVIVLSLLLATIALPTAIKQLALPADSSSRKAENQVRIAAAEAAINAVECAESPNTEADTETTHHSSASAQVITLYRHRIERLTTDDGLVAAHESAAQIQHQLRLVGLRAERDEILRLGSHHDVSEVTLRKIISEIDLQEARYSM